MTRIEAESSEGPSISIVVTTASFLRLSWMLRLFDSIQAQGYPKLEVICVVERVPELARRIEERGLEMRCVVRVVSLQERLGANAARNIGITKAKGDIIAIIDDDALLDSDWAFRVAKAYADERVVGVTGPVIPLWEEGAASWWPKELEWVIGCSGWFPVRRRQYVRGVLGTNASFRRIALVGSLYNSHLGPAGHSYERRSEWGEIAEETELSLRLRRLTGKLLVYDPEVKVYHTVPAFKTRLNFAIQRSFQVGQTKKGITKLGKYSTKDVLGPEFDLLLRIFVHVAMPNTQNMREGHLLHKLLLALVCVESVGLGYLIGGLRSAAPGDGSPPGAGLGVVASNRGFANSNGASKTDTLGETNERGDCATPGLNLGNSFIATHGR